MIKNLKRLHSRDGALSETIDTGMVQAAKSSITPGTSRPGTASSTQNYQQRAEAPPTGATIIFSFRSIFLLCFVALRIAFDDLFLFYSSLLAILEGTASRSDLGGDEPADAVNTCSKDQSKPRFSSARESFFLGAPFNRLADIILSSMYNRQ